MGRTHWMNWKEYLASDVWKCDKSPTGAHHWVAMEQSMELKAKGYFRCKHCGDVKQFPTTFQSTMENYRISPDEGLTGYNPEVGYVGTRRKK